MKKLLFLIVGFVALNIAVARAAPGVLPALSAPGFFIQLKNGGGFVVANGGETYALESQFSYPMICEGNWNTLVANDEKSNSGEWKWSASPKPNGFVIEAVGKAYFYDGAGKQIEGELKTREANGATIFTIEVPANGAAVIEKMNHR